MIDVNIQEVASVSEVASSKCEGKKHDGDDCKDVLHVLIHERDRMPTCFCSFFASLQEQVLHLTGKHSSALQKKSQVWLNYVPFSSIKLCFPVGATFCSSTQGES